MAGAIPHKSVFVRVYIYILIYTINTHNNVGGTAAEVPRGFIPSTYYNRTDGQKS